MNTNDLTPRPGDRSALDSLLEKVTPYEKVGAVIPFDLLQFGLFGSVITIVTGLLALAMPGADSIRSSDFYLLLGGVVASLVTLTRALAGPAIIFGGALLVLDAVLMTVRTSARWRSVIVLQAAAGGLGGVLATAFLALVILNLVIWIALAALVLMAIGALLAVLAGGS
jgi:hypothetical protein